MNFKIVVLWTISGLIIFGSMMSCVVNHDLQETEQVKFICNGNLSQDISKAAICARKLFGGVGR